MPKQGLVYDLAETVYHDDRVSLSSTGAKTLLRSPAQYVWELDHPASSPAFDAGSLTHALVLGQDHPYVCKDWDGRTTEGKARAAEVAEFGLTALPADSWADAHGMAEAVLNNKVAAKLLSQGAPEVSAYALDKGTGVWMRGRFDWLRDGMIVDLKTCVNADPKAWARKAAELKYDVQQEWYRAIFHAITGVWVDFVFILVENAAPHLTSVVRLDDAAGERGRRLGEIAREIFRDCQTVNVWPQWPNTTDEIVEVSLPFWALNYDPLN